MKKIFFLLCALFSLSAFAQTDVSSVKDVKFFGVDFSKVKVYGASEMPRQFQIAFERINNLFISEPGKYDVGKHLRKNVYDVSVEEVNARIEEMDTKEMKTSKKEVSLSQEDLQSAVNALSIEKEDGVGVVMVAALLNKNKATGHYYMVFFDMTTKQILSSKAVSGEAGGSGLRNYWANSIYDILKKKSK